MRTLVLASKVKVDALGKTFVSTPLSQGGYVEFYSSVDINDRDYPGSSDDSISVCFDLWQAVGGWLDFDGDTALNLDTCVSHSIMNGAKPGHTTGDRMGSGDWGAVWYDIDTVFLEKDQTTMIVPKDGSKIYTVPANGNLRYIGEQRFYVFVLAVGESFIHTIIVPESVYYDSKLGSILLESKDNPEKKDELPTGLRDIEFSEPDNSDFSLSYSIRGVLAADVNIFQVMLVIQYLTMNKTGKYPYEAIDITKNIYLLGLPKDVLELVPIVPPKISEQDKINEGFWSSFAAGISDIAGFIWNGICAIGEFLLSVANAIVQFGLAVLGAIWAAIQAVASVLLKLLSILIDFMLGAIKWVIDQIIKPIVLTT